MAVQQPTDIPRPWASNGGQYAQVPDTTSDAGRASWSEGFPPETSLPVAQGGIPPNRLDFQGVLNALSAHAVFKQAGGTYAWNSGTAYPKGAVVLYTDGKLYCATQDTNAGDAPTGPKWVSVVTSDALAAALTSALAAYLLRSGGVMTGPIVIHNTADHNDIIARLYDATSTLLLQAGTEWETCAHVALRGPQWVVEPNLPSVPGSAELVAANSTMLSRLVLTPDGKLYLNNQLVASYSPV